MKAFFGNPIVRWISVVPGAFLAVIAAQFPWHWVVLLYANFIGYSWGETETLGLGFLVRTIGPENVEYSGYGFLTPFVLISVAARIAPTFKNATAIVTACFVIIFWVYNWTIGHSLLIQQGMEIDVIQALVANGLAIIGIWVALKHARPWWEERKP